MNKIRKLLAHLHKWFKTYVIGTLTVFPVVWIAAPQLQALLPPKAVSVCASVAGAVMLWQLLAAKRAEKAAKS